MATEFHLYLPQLRMTHDAIVERALAAEAAGFAGIAFMDHLAPPMAYKHEMWEAMEIAGWVLAKTSTLKAGHLVLCDAFRHPSVLARQVASLDHASGGRFELGIGWGSVTDEFATFGMGTTEPRARVDRLGESLTVMKALWSGESVDFDGSYFTLARARQAPVPTRPVTVTIGGVGPRTLALVREHATWWNVPVTELGRIGELRDQAGDAQVSVQAMVSLVASEAERAEAEALNARRYAGTAMLANTVVGTAAELTEHFAALRDQGIGRFYAWFTDFAPPPTLAAFAEVIRAVAA